MKPRQAAELRKLLQMSSGEKLNCVITVKISCSFANALKVAAAPNVSVFVRKAVAKRLGELVDAK